MKCFFFSFLFLYLSEIVYFAIKAPIRTHSGHMLPATLQEPRTNSDLEPVVGPSVNRITRADVSLPSEVCINALEELRPILCARRGDFPHVAGRWHESQEKPGRTQGCFSCCPHCWHSQHHPLPSLSPWVLLLSVPGSAEANPTCRALPVASHPPLLSEAPAFILPALTTEA